MYDSELDNIFKGYMGNRKYVEFEPSSTGLYFYDLRTHKNISFLETVDKNRFPYSDAQFT